MSHQNTDVMVVWVPDFSLQLYINVRDVIRVKVVGQLTTSV